MDKLLKKKDSRFENIDKILIKTLSLFNPTLLEERKLLLNIPERYYISINNKYSSQKFFNYYRPGAY